MLSPKFGRKNPQNLNQQQNPNVDPYNSNLTLASSPNNPHNTTYRPQQIYTKSQYKRKEEPKISLSQANTNAKSESTGFLASLGTLGRKKKQQEGE